MQTRLLDSYYGSDTVMLTELALIGRFKTIDEVQFLRRIHPGSSFYLTRGDQQEFAAPGQRRAPPGRLFLSLECARAVMRAKELTVRQKAGCLAIIAARASRVVRNRVGREVRKVIPPFSKALGRKHVADG